MTVRYDAGVADGSASVPSWIKCKYLAIYFLFNLGLTLYNKAVMVQFPFPFLLTALHAAAGTLGCHIFLARGYFTPSHLSRKELGILCLFSLLYTGNIAISNVSLNMATIPFHQVVRATTPVFAVTIYRVLFQASYSSATYLSLVPVIAGVGLATYGDYATTMLGFVMTLLGAFLAAVKTVTTNRIQTGSLRLSAMEILHRMSPLALVQSLFFAYLFGEMAQFRTEVLLKHRLGVNILGVLLVNGAIAFGLNVISFAANKQVGALTMTVAANVKQILTIVLSVAFFKLVVGVMHALGIVLTLVGAGWYAKVEMTERQPVVNPMAEELEEGLATGNADLDYVCPFSAKMFHTINTAVIPLLKAHYASKLQLIFRQQIQPWHPSSTLVHEAGAAVLRVAPDQFWAFSARLFERQTEFFDVSVVNETRNQTYERLVKIAGEVGVDGGKVRELLVVSDRPGEDGGLNVGNGVTDDVKLMVKANRLTGVHVTPTVLFNGVVENGISSGFTKEQWEEWLKKNVV